MVLMWDVQTRSKIGNPLEGHTGYVNSISFSPDGVVLYSASRDGTIRCWESSSGEPVGHPLTGHKYEITSLDISPNGRYIVTGSWDESIRIWNSDSFTRGMDQALISCSSRDADISLGNMCTDDGEWARTTEGVYLLWVPRGYLLSMYRDMSLLCIGKDKGGEGSG